MTTERIRVIDGRSVPHVWFNFEVDDLPLDAYELRMYFHIVRRGSKSGLCNESVDNMAKHCRMSSGVAKRAIRTLIKLGLIRREAHAGRPSDYVVQDMSDWNTEEINALKEGGSETTQVIRRPRLSDDPGYQTTETQVVSDPGLGHERSTPGSETTHKVDQFKKDSLSNSIEGFSNTPLTPQSGGNVVATIDSSEVREPESEPHTEIPATPAIAPNSSTAEQSGLEKVKGSGRRSKSKTGKTKKGRLARNSEKTLKAEAALLEPERFERFWTEYGKLANEAGKVNRGDLASSMLAWTELIESGVNLDDVARGFRLFSGKVRMAKGFGFVQAQFFLAGKANHEVPYWLESLSLAGLSREPESPNEFTSLTPVEDKTEQMFNTIMEAIA
ncbi:MAG: hypothetical protein AAFY20_18720 [Cyanobacteria bacterium J06639_14]